MSDLIPSKSDLAFPEEAIRHYLRQATSANTRKALKCDLEHFTAWGGSIPCEPATIAAYLTDHAEILTIATLRRRLTSITKAHRMAGFDTPVKSELVQMVMKGIARVHGKPQEQAAPLLKDDLVALLSYIPDTVKGIRDKALLLIGFAGAFRKSELVALKCNHLEFTKEGVIITLTRSKTDQTGIGRQIGIPYAKGRICPVQALQSWMAHLPTQEGYLFRSVSKGGNISPTGRLSDRAVSNIIKEYVTLIGLDPAKYSGHSLRAGLATSAAMQGVSSWKIRAQTGHKSDTMLNRYIRHGDLFNENVLQSLI